MQGSLHVVGDVAQAFADLTIDLYRHRPRDGFVLVLTGGSSARSCYPVLAARSQQVDWSAVTILFGDERCVPPDHPDSNAGLARSTLLEGLEHRPTLHAMSCDDGAGAYAELVDAQPGIDLLHLGLGSDGHIASLFPGSPALGTDEVVVRTRDPSGRATHERLSLTLATIARADHVVVTVTGPGKRDALAAVAAGAPVPASQLDAASVTWLVDAAAAGGLDPTLIPGSAR